MKWKLYHLLLASVLSFGGQVVQPLRDFDFVAAQTAPPPSPTQSKIQQGLELVIQGRNGMPL